MLEDDDLFLYFSFECFKKVAHLVPVAETAFPFLMSFTSWSIEIEQTTLTCSCIWAERKQVGIQQQVGDEESAPNYLGRSSGDY